MDKILKLRLGATKRFEITHPVGSASREALLSTVGTSATSARTLTTPAKALNQVKLPFPVGGQPVLKPEAKLSFPVGGKPEAQPSLGSALDTHQVKVVKAGITLTGRARIVATAQVDGSPAGFSNTVLVEFVD